jgi:hypothetical protein
VSEQISLGTENRAIFVPYNHSLCKVDGMYGADINGTTRTVCVGAMTVLKRDGTALIPASIVNVLKGMDRIFSRTYE